MEHRSYSAMRTAPFDRLCVARSLQWIRWTTVASVALLAAIAAVVSFGHMRELALRHGEASWSATLIPLSVDGMVVAASMSVLLASRLGRRGEWLRWTLLIVGSLASLAANVAAANPNAVSRLIAAWPSFAFVGAYHLLQGQLRIGRVDAAERSDEVDRWPGAGGLRDHAGAAARLDRECDGPAAGWRVCRQGRAATSSATGLREPV
jgi:hypothetical protein